MQISLLFGSAVSVCASLRSRIRDHDRASCARPPRDADNLNCSKINQDLEDNFLLPLSQISLVFPRLEYKGKIPSVWDVRT